MPVKKKVSEKQQAIITKAEELNEILATLPKTDTNIKVIDNINQAIRFIVVKNK